MLDKLCMSVAEDLSDCNLHLNIEEICNAYLGIDSPSPMMTFAKLSSACCIVLTNQAKSPSAPSSMADHLHLGITRLRWHSCRIRI